MSTFLYCAFDFMLLSCHVCISQSTLYFPECLGIPCLKQVPYLNFKWLHKTQTHNQLAIEQTLKHLVKLANWLSCDVSSYLYLILCYYHVNYEFQREPKLYLILNFKELLARNRRNVLRLNNYNGIQTQINLAPKQTLNHLVKLAK